MAGPSKLYVKQIQIKAAAHTSFLKLCSNSHHHRVECMQKPSSMERTKKDLNVFGSIKENNKRDSECMWNH